MGRVLSREDLITAIAAEEVLAKAIGDGALRIFEKPVDLPALLRLLDDTVPETRPV